MSAWCIASGAPPPVVVGGVGADDDPSDERVGVVVKRAGTDGKAELEGSILSVHGGRGEFSIFRWKNTLRLKSRHI